MAVLCLSMLFVASSCGQQDDDNGDDDRNPQINAIYATYVSYMAEQGETPLGYEAWLLSIRGADGADGANGLTPYIKDGNWWIGDTDTEVPARGEDGKDGADGANGLTPYIKDGNWWIGDTDTEVPARGEDGTDGKDGKNGVGINKVEVDDSGYLWIYLTDGTAQQVKLPTAQTEEHNFGPWMLLSDGDTCEDKIYFRYCADCNETQMKKIDHTEVFSFDSEGHGWACKECGYVISYTKHTLDASGKCTGCDYCLDDGNTNPPDDGGNDEISYDIYWKETPIIYELTMESDGGQFPSGAERYYAGDGTWKTSTQKIDVMIRKRNDDAMKATKTKINYKYIQQGSGFDWSASVEEIYKQTRNYTPGSSTDIYSNFVYDLTCAAAKGCFANLKSNTEFSESKYGTGQNYFRFNEADYEFVGESYFDSYVGEGYFYQYMLSLTLSDDKVYCLGSDYCTDLVRAFHVVPVHIDLMNTIDRDDLVELVQLEDVEFDDDMTNIQLLYEIIWANRWTYNTLLDFSHAVYNDNGVGAGADGSGIAGADITDTLGFALPARGSLAPSGILYTSSVKIIGKQHLTADEKAAYLADPEKAPYVVGDYYIAYPDTNTELVAFGNALRQLFQSGTNQGVCVAGRTSDIRASFVNGTLLFGSVISLGSLEDEDYQSLREGAGFGIVPVPVYRDGDEYQTFVHNNARIVAIANKTLLYEQCSAYLDYQSRCSSEILEEYYTVQLAQSLLGETSDDNKMMLTYIRNHVCDVFDKTFDDIMYDFNAATDADATYRRWHELIQKQNYQVSDMDQLYNENKIKKETDLLKVINAWKELK